VGFDADPNYVYVLFPFKTSIQHVTDEVTLRFCVAYSWSFFLRRDLRVSPSSANFLIPSWSLSKAICSCKRVQRNSGSLSMYETLGSLLEEAISGIRVRLRIETFHQVFIAFAMEGCTNLLQHRVSWEGVRCHSSAPREDWERW
jgi:hypothetical protein